MQELTPELEAELEKVIRAFPNFPKFVEKVRSIEELRAWAEAAQTGKGVTFFVVKGTERIQGYPSFAEAEEHLSTLSDETYGIRVALDNPPV